MHLFPSAVHHADRVKVATFTIYFLWLNCASICLSKQTNPSAVCIYSNTDALLFLVFVENVPEELREPFYTDQYDQEHIKPPVVNLLLSAELYCRAGSLILKSDAAKPLLGHDAVIQALAQKGLYVTDQEKLVTERDLHKKPIQMVSVKSWMFIMFLIVCSQ